MTFNVSVLIERTRTWNSALSCESEHWLVGWINNVIDVNLRDGVCQSTRCQGQLWLRINEIICLLLSFFGAGERAVESVFDQPAVVRRVCVGAVSGFRVRPTRPPQAVAHADAEGTRAVHPHENLFGGWERRTQISRLPVQNRSRETHANRRICWIES